MKIDATALVALAERRIAAVEKGLSLIADRLRASADEQFGTGGNPSWVPLSPHTIAKKTRDGYPRMTRDGTIAPMTLQNARFGPENVLIRTGALRESWTDSAHLSHVEIIDVENGSVRIGSALPYAATHQYGREGGGYQGSDIPARPIVVTDRDRRIAAEIMNTALNEQ